MVIVTTAIIHTFSLTLVMTGIWALGMVNCFQQYGVGRDNQEPGSGRGYGR